MQGFPSNKEIKFKKVHKALTARLSAVIRSLSTKPSLPTDQKRTRAFLGVLQPGPIEFDPGRLPFWSAKGQRSPHPHKVTCMFAEVAHAVIKFWAFVKVGEPKVDREIKYDIERLEWIRDNWDEIEPVGNLATGFLLTRRM